ncbi:unnamed protein product [Linum tenue]|uniref:Uncharacterized protein n=1 Tax=Linum tenue TaxID=586396 RepID=A0AAV0R1G9_9ROSI|nr:unnamed protein product [Linum tenue]
MLLHDETLRSSSIGDISREVTAGHQHVSLAVRRDDDHSPQCCITFSYPDT